MQQQWQVNPKDTATTSAANAATQPNSESLMRRFRILRKMIGEAEHEADERPIKKAKEKADEQPDEKAEDVEPKSNRLDKVYKEFVEAIQAAETAKDDVGYMLKFKQDRAGVKMSLSSAQSLQILACESLNTMLECGKVIKPLLPKQAAEAEE